MNTIKVSTTPQTIAPHAKVEWDPECFTVSCRIEYPLAKQQQRISLSEALDKQLGINLPSYVLTADKLSMLLDSEYRLSGLDFYTNPERWTQFELEFSDGLLSIPHFEATFDTNGHADDLAGPEAFYEPERGTLYLSWGAATKWHVIAPPVAIGVTNDRRLAQIRLDGLVIPKHVHKPTGLWAKSLKRFGFGD